MYNRDIQIVINGLGIGGTERHLGFILPRLAQRGYNIRIFSLSNDLTLAPLFTRAGIEIDAPSPRLFENCPAIIRMIFRLVYEFYRLYRNFRLYPHLLTHFFLPRAYILGMLAALFARFKGPLVMSRRSLNIYQRQYPLVGQLERFLHRYTIFILGNSQRVQTELREQEKIPAHKLGLLYNGIDTAGFNNTVPRQTMRQQLQLSSDAVVFIIVANILPYKGHLDLLQALSLIHNQLPSDWQLLIVGEDRGIQQELVAYARQAGIHKHLQWLGGRPDIAQLLMAADIGISASHEEGFSNAVLESMAASLPMVATNVGGNGEAVLDGETGYVVPAHAPEKLGQRLLHLAHDPQLRKRMGQKARLRLEEHFSLESCVNRYDRFYQALLAHQLPLTNEKGEIET